MPRDIVDILRYDAGSRPGGICEAAAKEIERLRADNAALRALLVECRPSMVEHRKRVEQDLTNATYFPGRYPETLKALNTERDICDALLDRIDAAVQR
jgi:hypothetical protein